MFKLKTIGKFAHRHIGTLKNILRRTTLNFINFQLYKLKKTLSLCMKCSFSFG